ncbi:MAG: hypothetical protein E7022_03325 [Desulfovibrio desulfuricans]|nr:hypothetical protein [Desulfovibrio desulfuricans]
MCQLSPVQFHGDMIFCIDYHGEPFAPVKPIIENMGMDWRAQATKLRASKERWGVVIIATPSEGGEQETTCLPVRKLPAFLASINPRKVKPELRPRIELYQRECDDALWDYWTKGRAERPITAPSTLPSSDAPLTPEQQCTLQNIVKAKVESLPEAQRKGRGLYPQIWSRFNNHFRIARYCQLPQCRLAEAVAYLVRLDIEPKQKALPQPEALSMPKPDTNREKFVRFLEKVEALRAQTDRTLRDLAVEGAALLDDDRFGTTRWNTSSIIHDWLLNVVPRPLEIRPDFEMARGLFAFLHDVENLLPLRWR